jgi:hypothetical protein
MRDKKVLLLILALVSLAGLAAGTLAEAGGTHSCPICTTYENGSTCCVSCICDDAGHLVACTNHYCPPAGGGA